MATVDIAVPSRWNALGREWLGFLRTLASRLPNQLDSQLHLAVPSAEFTRRILLPLQLFLHTETPGALILLIAAWRHDRTHPAVGKLEDPLHDLLLCRFEHAR
jgi:hypothetical protein